MRVLPAVLIGVSLMALTACGGDDTPAASPPAATAAVETTAAAEPAGAPAAGDKKLCEDAEKAGKAMKTELIKVMSESQGEMPTAEVKKILAGLGDELTKVAGTSDSAVGTAVKDFAAKSTEASSAADPVTASDNPAYEKSGKDLTAACKAAGVKVAF
jgi:hypothetical protein